MSYYDEGYYLKGYKSGYGGRFAPYIEEYYYPIAKQASKTLIKIFNPKTVLELGCARGYLVRALREAGIEAYGVDISEWAIRNCDDKVKDYVYLGNIKDLSRWKDKHFDLVIAKDILEHIPKEDLSIALTEIVRVCSKYIYTYIPIIDNGVDKTHVSIYPTKWWIQKFTKRRMYTCSIIEVKQIDGITTAEIVFSRNKITI